MGPAMLLPPEEVTHDRKFRQTRGIPRRSAPRSGRTQSEHRRRRCGPGSGPRRSRANRNRVVVTGRVEIDNVQPVVSCGEYPAKAVVGEMVRVSAAVWREGHEAVAATLVVRYLGPCYPQVTEIRRIKAVAAPGRPASA